MVSADQNVTLREVQSAIEHLESARMEMARIAFATIDPLAKARLLEIIARDINPTLKTLEYWKRLF